MKNWFIYIGILLIIEGYTFLSAGCVYSQITSQTKDFSQTISYPPALRKDTLFVFYSPGTTNKKGSLIAFAPVAGNYNFTWSKYNPVSSNFDPPFYSEINVAQSTVNNLFSGGYKARCWNGGIDTTYFAWVLIDNFSVNVLKDGQGKVLPSQYTCDYITVNGIINSDLYTYYDTLTHVPQNIPGGYNFLWTSDNPELIIPWPDTSLISNRSYNPPYIDTWYYLTATDNYGMTQKDSVLYESIVVKPGFSFQIYDKQETKDFINVTSKVEEDAPLRVRFINESLNGNIYEWIFSDNIRSGFFASEITQNFDYMPEFSYNIPHDYYPAIIVTSEEGCVDSFRVSDPITIKPSLLEIPNVFSPDGDSNNDYFKVKHQSIKEFNIWIFNRNGKTVYKAEIKDLYEWAGWDGNILNTGKPASPGTYYYVIEATGWDSEKYHKGQYAGVVYLFREGE